MSNREHRNWATRVAIFVPYAWLVAFFLLPFLIVLKISFSQSDRRSRPTCRCFDPAADGKG